jgi:hypothetical protein
MRVYGDSISCRIKLGDTTSLTIYNIVGLVISQSESIEVISCLQDGVDFEPLVEDGRILYGFSPFDSLNISFGGYGYLDMWGTTFFAIGVGIGPPDSLEWTE